jgi:hypothetical protein
VYGGAAIHDAPAEGREPVDQLARFLLCEEAEQGRFLLLGFS